MQSEGKEAAEEVAVEREEEAYCWGVSCVSVSRVGADLKIIK